MGAARPSLHEFAVACCVPGKLDVAGADVADLCLAERSTASVEYNAADAVTAHLLMLRIGLHTGQLARDDYEREIAAVRVLVSEQAAADKGQFVRFVEVWNSE
jgi:predicted PolB exonuclease-like 3'-5' exonuclease